MKIQILIIYSLFLNCFELTAQTEFVLGTSQSMIMTGKGTGQDATVNPYFGQSCFAIIKNIGELKFSIRVQRDGKIIKEISILKDELKKVKLLKNYELYLDPNPKGKSKASINYEKVNE